MVSPVHFFSHSKLSHVHLLINVFQAVLKVLWQTVDCAVCQRCVGGVQRGETHVLQRSNAVQIFWPELNILKKFFLNQCVIIMLGKQMSIFMNLCIFPVHFLLPVFVSGAPAAQWWDLWIWSRLSCFFQTTTSHKHVPFCPALSRSAGSFWRTGQSVRRERLSPAVHGCWELTRALLGRWWVQCSWCRTLKQPRLSPTAEEPWGKNRNRQAVFMRSKDSCNDSNVFCLDRVKCEN